MKKSLFLLILFITSHSFSMSRLGNRISLSTKKIHLRNKNILRFLCSNKNCKDKNPSSDPLSPLFVGAGFLSVPFAWFLFGRG